MNTKNDAEKSPNSEDLSINGTPKKRLKYNLVVVCVALLISIVVITLPRLNKLLASNEQALLTYSEVWPIKFKDAFNDNSLSYWKSSEGVVDPSIERLVTNYGHFDITFAPTQDSIVRDAFYNTQSPANKNFLLTLKVKPPLSCHTGLTFRGTTQGDYYVFLVGNDSYTTEILRRNNGVDLPREAILLNTPLPEGIGQPNILNVLAYDDSYYFYINRIFVDKISDGRLHGEQTGIELMVCNGVSSESVFHIDEFTLKTPYIFSLH